MQATVFPALRWHTRHAHRCFRSKKGRNCLRGRATSTTSCSVSGGSGFTRNAQLGCCIHRSFLEALFAGGKGHHVPKSDLLDHDLGLQFTSPPISKTTLVLPVCSTSTRSPYFLGASFPMTHLRVSTRSLDL